MWHYEQSLEPFCFVHAHAQQTLIWCRKPKFMFKTHKTVYVMRIFRSVYFFCTCAVDCKLQCDSEHNYHNRLWQEAIMIITSLGRYKELNVSKISIFIEPATADYNAFKHESAPRVYWRPKHLKFRTSLLDNMLNIYRFYILISR